MQIRWRKNPKTEDGWFKRIAISSLIGLAAFVVTFPVAFFLVLNHLRQATAGDPQTFLNAITSAVVVGILVAGVSFFAAMSLLLLISFRGKPARS